MATRPSSRRLSHPAVERPRRLAVRAGLALLGAGQAVTASWALLAPRAFYDDFPGGGLAWVSALPLTLLALLFKEERR